MPESFPLGRGKGMTRGELQEFLRTSRAFVKIATLDPDGWPMVNPAWYTYEDGCFYIVTKEKAGFCRNLRRDPRATLLIDNPELPYKRDLVPGTAEFIDEDWHERGRQMVLRYLGPDGFAYYDATTGLPRVTFRVTPLRITIWNGGGIDRTFFEPSIWHEAPAATGETG
jgi:PPOX class probable F420-dependent enzyme